MKTAYTYIVLRYVHDTTTGEFVNVAVALYAPQALFLSAICRTTYARLTKVFPGMDGERFRSLMRYVQAKFEEKGQALRDELAYDGRPASIVETAYSIVPRDESSLQWSEMGSGLTDDPSATLEKIYRRMVEAYELPDRRSGRDDDAVWKTFRRELEQQRVLSRLGPKTIASRLNDDEIAFEYTWKNNQWHCLEPISFDLLDPDSIRRKAHGWLGQITSVRDSLEPFKVYLLLGEPQHEALKSAFRTAENILNKMPVEKEFVYEHQSAAFAQTLASEIERHDESVKQSALPDVAVTQIEVEL